MFFFFSGANKLGLATFNIIERNRKPMRNRKPNRNKKRVIEHLKFILKSSACQLLSNHRSLGQSLLHNITQNENENNEHFFWSGQFCLCCAFTPLLLHCSLAWQMKCRH